MTQQHSKSERGSFNMPRYTVSSFPPEFLSLFLSATTSTLTFPMTFNEATNRRAHFHSLRAAMRRESHPAADAIGCVVISITPPRKVGDGTGPVVLTFQPRDMGFLAMIKKALPEAAAQSVATEVPETSAKLAGGEYDYLSGLLGDEDDDL